jgi:hypothetical protein
MDTIRITGKKRRGGKPPLFIFVFIHTIGGDGLDDDCSARLCCHEHGVKKCVPI